jgi:hypothetical protein
MYRKIISAALLLSFLVSCKAKEPEDGYGVCISDEMCKPILKTSEYFSQAEKGDRAAIITAIFYYSECSGADDSLSKEMYWAKKLADKGEAYYISYMAGAARLQIDPKSNSRDLAMPTDPLLYWAWKKKACDLEKNQPQSEKTESCSALTQPDWITEAQWKKIITSPPTVKDRKWYQYLPKGCENGECLPK